MIIAATCCKPLMAALTLAVTNRTHIASPSNCHSEAFEIRIANSLAISLQHHWEVIVSLFQTHSYSMAVVFFAPHCNHVSWSKNVFFKRIFISIVLPLWSLVWIIEMSIICWTFFYVMNFIITFFWEKSMHFVFCRATQTWLSFLGNTLWRRHKNAFAHIPFFSNYFLFTFTCVAIFMQ